MDHVVVRPAMPDDRDAVLDVVGLAFGQQRQVELVERVWASPDWLPHLELVCVDEDVVVGHVLCSRATVDDVPVVALGPLAVRPSHQRSGLGSSLMERLLERAGRTDEVMIGLLGHPTYYPRFGFTRGAEVGVLPPFPMDDDTPFMIRGLGNGPTPTGTFRFGAAFD